MIRNLVYNPRSYARSTLDAIWALLFDPERFYDDHLPESGYGLEFAVVGLAGVLGALGLVYAVDRLLDPFVVGAGPAGDFQDLDGVPLDRTTGRLMWGRAVRPIVEAYVLWFLYAAAFYAVSWLYTDRGTYGALLKTTAWGFVPYAIYQAVFSLGTFVAFFRIDEVDTDLGTGTSEEFVDMLFDQGMNDPFFAIAGLSGILFLIWAWYVWVHAVRKARNLPEEAARRVVAVPIAIHSLYLLWVFGGRLF